MSWRPLGDSDLPPLTELAAACLATDGGQPYAADPDFLGGLYLTDAVGRACVHGGTLIGAVSLRQAAAGSPAAALGAAAVTTGLVHPAWRRRGIGGQAFDWARQRADGTICAETETLGDGAHALYLSRGLSRVFAEQVMRLPASVGPPGAAPPAGLTLSRWGQADPARFYAVYTAAFRDRPGFPGWPLARWSAWISEDEDFRADWTLLAEVDGTDAGFIACAVGGWIAQMGVVPEVRRQGVGAYLVAEAVRRMRAGGESAVTLNVNVNNTRAAALYRGLGFSPAGTRARYLSRG